MGSRAEIGWTMIKVLREPFRPQEISISFLLNVYNLVTLVMNYVFGIIITFSVSSLHFLIIKCNEPFLKGDFSDVGFHIITNKGG